MIRVATQMAGSPDASTPHQTETWADCKAAYRLFDQEEVTFAAVVTPHQALTREAVSAGTWLVINDTTEIDFGYDRDLPGVGRVGNAQARGFYLHSALAVAAEGDEIAGLLAQDLYARPLEKVRRVSSAERKHLPRETEVWGRVVDRSGVPNAGARWIHLCDRGADDFETYCHFLAQGVGWVVRAAQLKRLVLDAHGECLPLETVLAESPLLGGYELEVGKNRQQPARTAKLEVRCTAFVMRPPQAGRTRYVERSGIEEIRMWAVEVREPAPPTGVEPLHWVLLTSEPVRNFEDAWRVIGWYEKRPIIEEYHKCLKTGCRVEQRLYQTGDRLAPVIGLLSVLALRLLQLKVLARTHPETPAADVVPKSWLIMLPLVAKRRLPIRTIRDFVRRLAGLGGFLGRKGDGEPGWQTIWHGLEKLLLMVRGAEAYREKCG